MKRPQALVYLSESEKADVRRAKELLRISESNIFRALALPTIRKVARMKDEVQIRKLKAQLLMRMDGSDE